MNTTRRIFIVDESPKDREVAINILQHEGFLINYSSDTTSLYILAKMFDPHIFLIDISLSGISGLEFLEKLDIGKRNAEAIMMSGEENVEDSRRAIDLGAIGFINKPINHKDLVLQINRALERVQAREEQEQYKTRLEEEVSASREDINSALKIADYQSRQIDLLLNSMSEPLIAVDMDRTIMILNSAAEKQLELSTFNSIGTPFEKHIQAPNLLIALNSMIEKFRSTNEVLTISPVKAKINNRIFSISINAINNVSDNPSGFILIFNDQTELYRSAQLRSGFLTLVAHEFRTPLSSLFNGLSIIQDANGEPESIADAVEIMHASSKKLSGLVNSLIIFSNVQRPGAKAELHEVDIEALLNSSLEKNASNANSKNITITLRCCQNVSNILTDEQLLGDAFECIIDNAIKFSPDQGQVIVNVERISHDLSSTLQISIRDQGPGIPEEKRQQMFDWFAQGEDYLTRSCSGMGIGLPLALRAIELLSGTIEISTPPQSEGCIILFKIPIEASN